jgi:hypothetical protein
MSITINTNPASGSTAQDDLWHVATSTASGSTDMKYVFDIYVSGNRKISVRQFPEPSNGKAYFNAGPTVRNSMTFNWFEPLGSAYVYEPNLTGEMAVQYDIRVGEEVSGVTTFNLASGSVTAYNYNAPLFKRRVATLSDRLNKWLTVRPLYANTKLGENLYIPFYTNAALNLKCSTFDGSNTLIATASGSTTTIENGFVQMNIGSTAIATELGITINDSVNYYDVWFNSFDKIRVYVVCNPKYNPINIHFMNSWGMWDSERFDLVSKLNMNVERKGFEQRDYRFNGNAVDYKSASNRYYEGAINYSNKSNFTYKLTADALTDDEYTWMADLIVSPQILMEIEGYFYPVTLTENNYEFSKNVFNKLKALELTFNMNQTRYSQLR